MRPTDPGTPGPQLPDPRTPPGYGEPRPPGGGQFAAEASVLVDAAGAWDDVSKALKKAWGLAAEGWGDSSLFGYEDTLFTNGRLHAQVNEVVVNGCADGSVITAQLADGLVETANDFSGTDSTQGDNFRVLEDRAGQ